MGLKNYLKRLFKYVAYEHKQPIIHSDVIVSKSNKIHSDKIYLITGGGSGLGYAIAEKLVNEGAYVIITGRDKNKLIKAKEKLGDNCDFYIMDVSDIKDTNNIIEKIFNKYNRIDGIINNAGISLHEKNILDVSIENYDKQFDTNLKGAYFVSKKYIEMFFKAQQKNGSIIFVSSERGSMCDDIPYGLTKVAINSLTEGLSRRFFKDGIRVNSIAPGVTCSNLTGISSEDDLYSNNASGRILLPEEIAEITSFILSDYSRCVSGEIIHCDGGNHIASYF